MPTSVDVTGVSASYGAFGIDFSSIDQPNGGADSDITNIVAGFDLAPTTQLALGLNEIDSDNGADDASGWYGNVTYKFPAQKNVSAFFEVGGNDKTNEDLGYLIGLRIKI